MNVNGLFNLASKFIEFLQDRPDVKENKKNALTILPLVFVALQYIIANISANATLERQALYFIFAAVVCLLAVLWVIEVVRPSRWIIYLLPLILIPLTSFGIYYYGYRTSNVNKIAPNLLTFGKTIPYTTSYGSNARILETQIYERAIPTGPDLFIRLKFQLFCEGIQDDCSAGWIIGGLSGIDPNLVQDLVFEVRGAQGNEIVGITLKDRSLNETRINDLGTFIGDTGIATDWKTVRIPLIQFSPVDLETLQIISFFVDAKYTPYPIIDFDVANIRFE